MLNRLVFILGLIGCLFVSVSARVVPGISVAVNDSGYHVEFSVSDHHVKVIEHGDEVFSIITVDGYHMSHDVQHPELPFITFNVPTLSDSGEQAIRNTTYSRITEKLKYSVWRSLPHRAKDGHVDNTGDAGALMVDTLIVSMDERFSISGYTGINVIIRPFSYDSLANELHIVTRASFDIVIGDSIRSLKRRILNDGASSIYREFFIDVEVPFQGEED